MFSFMVEKRVQDLQHTPTKQIKKHVKCIPESKHFAPAF